MKREEKGVDEHRKWWGGKLEVLPTRSNGTGVEPTSPVHCQGPGASECPRCARQLPTSTCSAQAKRNATCVLASPVKVRWAWHTQGLIVAVLVYYDRRGAAALCVKPQRRCLSSCLLLIRGHPKGKQESPIVGSRAQLPWSSQGARVLPRNPPAAPAAVRGHRLL